MFIYWIFWCLSFKNCHIVWKWFRCTGNAFGNVYLFINGDRAPPVGQTNVFCKFSKKNYIVEMIPFINYEVLYNSATI